MIEIGILIATFGDTSWADQGRVAALAAMHHPADELVVLHHGDTIAAARNEADRLASVDWLIHLDADDELEPGYVQAMRSAIERHGPGALYAPRLRFVRAGAPDPEPTSIASRDMDRLNPCVVGTGIHRAMVADVGGWWEERAWEDWSLFRRAWLAGARLVEVPDAVYRVTVNPEGRNSTVIRPQQLNAEIRRNHRIWHNARKRSAR